MRLMVGGGGTQSTCGVRNEWEILVGKSEYNG